MRNLGGLVIVLYMIGACFTSGKSSARQDKSLIMRTYQAKLLTDKDMNELLGIDKDEDEESAMTD